ncbi:hypothetical protein CLFE_029460 [Clostridium felsineum DSM 794]|nr:hypothetical protein CLFE_029460 [Clostridium felsineum DSM 794]
MLIRMLCIALVLLMGIVNYLIFKTEGEDVGYGILILEILTSAITYVCIVGFSS